MITTQVQFSDFWQWLQNSDSYKNNFSYEGAKALFDYLETASDNGETDTMDFDPVAWCCEFSEYKDLNEFNNEYWGDGKNENKFTLDELNEHTIVISELPLVIADF